MSEEKWKQLALEIHEKYPNSELFERYGEEGEECWICDEEITPKQVVTTLFGDAAHKHHFGKEEEE